MGIRFERAGADGIATVTLANPAKLNAMSAAMWRALRNAFTALAADPGDTRVVLVSGEGGQFASGGDIEEYPAFRLDTATLARFHEQDVMPALVAMRDCRCFYTWRDLDRATRSHGQPAGSLKLPEGSRVAVQVEKSVEALLLYLATLRAGYVFLPLNTAYQSAEIEYFIGNAEPAVVVCSRATLAGSARSPSRRARACVHAGRRPHRQPAGARGALQRPSTPAARRATTWPPSSTPAAPPGAARARC
jgi:acyl-CoA synthetase (AMP-forming)/AMP-acid ligase II